MKSDMNPNYNPQSNHESSPVEDAFERHLQSFRPRQPQLDLEFLESAGESWRLGIPASTIRTGSVPIMGAAWCGGMLAGALITFLWMSNLESREQRTAQVDPVAANSEAITESTGPSMDGSLGGNEVPAPRSSTRPGSPVFDSTRWPTQFIDLERILSEPDVSLVSANYRYTSRGIRMISAGSSESTGSDSAGREKSESFGPWVPVIQQESAPTLNLRTLTQMMLDESI